MLHDPTILSGVAYVIVYNGTPMLHDPTPFGRVAIRIREQPSMQRLPRLFYTNVGIKQQ